MKTTTAISTVKRDVQLQEWIEQIKAQQESGMTVTAFCAQNGINIKTYCNYSVPIIIPQKGTEIAASGKL